MNMGKTGRCLYALIFLVMLLVAGCRSSSSTSSVEDPYPEQDISGVWMGWLGDSFAIGIIITDDGEEFSARFVAADGQFVTVEDYPFRQSEGSAIFTGELEDCYWDTTGQDYSIFAPQLLQVYTPASTRQVLGMGFPAGAYQYSETGEVGVFAFIYNTTYNKVSPNVNDISGQWEIQDSFRTGNTLVLTITPNTASTSVTTITGVDDRGNSFDGTIEIHYSPIDDNAYNVYDVNLTLNDAINLVGLATYVSEVHTGGIDMQKTFVVGATTEDMTYSIGGLAKKR